MLERSWLLNKVWGIDFPTTANSLEVYVGYLCRKTEADGKPRLLHTVRGVGYVLRERPRELVTTCAEGQRPAPAIRTGMTGLICLGVRTGG